MACRRGPEKRSGEHATVTKAKVKSLFSESPCSPGWPVQLLDRSAEPLPIVRLVRADREMKAGFCEVVLEVRVRVLGSRLSSTADMAHAQWRFRGCGKLICCRFEIHRLSYQNLFWRRVGRICGKAAGMEAVPLSITRTHSQSSTRSNKFACWPNAGAFTTMPSDHTRRRATSRQDPEGVAIRARKAHS